MRNETNIKFDNIKGYKTTESLTMGGWIMHTRTGKWTLNLVILVACIALLVWAAPDIKRHCGWGSDEDEVDCVRTSYIIQGEDLMDVSSLVHRAGGEITHTLPIINAVGARLTSDQFRVIRKSEMITRIDKDEPPKPINGSST